MATQQRSPLYRAKRHLKSIKANPDRVHVMPIKKKWAVMKEGSEKYVGRYANQKEAISLAKDFARKNTIMPQTIIMIA